jgi:hypothetical protein
MTRPRPLRSDDSPFSDEEIREAVWSAHRLAEEHCRVGLLDNIMAQLVIEGEYTVAPDESRRALPGTVAPDHKST